MKSNVTGLRDSAEYLTYARRARAAGIPLHIEEDDEEGATPPRGLIIHQVGGYCETSMFEISPSVVGYRIDLQITSNFPGRLGISSFGLELPWADPHFRWLDPCEDNGALIYRFPVDPPLEYCRDAVLNLYDDSTRTLVRGQFIRGYLLAIGAEIQGDKLQHGQTISAMLHVYDQFSRKYPYAIQLYTDRSKTLLAKRKALPPRKTIFDYPRRSE